MKKYIVLIFLCLGIAFTPSCATSKKHSDARNEDGTVKEEKKKENTTPVKREEKITPVKNENNKTLSIPLENK